MKLIDVTNLPEERCLIAGGLPDGVLLPMLQWANQSSNRHVAFLSCAILHFAQRAF